MCPLPSSRVRIAAALLSLLIGWTPEMLCQLRSRGQLVALHRLPS